MAMKWITTESDNRIERKELIDLYQAYLSRQLFDLNMHFRFTNYYVAGITVLFTAYVLGIVRMEGKPVSIVLLAFPLLAILLIHPGKLIAFRYYRRYIEGRVILSKIECLLGLDGPINPEKLPKRFSFSQDLWPDDAQFIPLRYTEQAQEKLERTSAKFIHSKSFYYGVGILTQKTFNVLLLSSWIAIFGQVLGMLIVNHSLVSILINTISGLFVVLISGCSTKWYFRHKKVIEMENFSKQLNFHE